MWHIREENEDGSSPALLRNFFVYQEGEESHIFEEQKLFKIKLKLFLGNIKFLGEGICLF